MVSAVDFFLIPAQGDGQRLEPGKRYLIGRGDDADIRLSDALASRHHAELTWDPDRLWLLNDLGSANGTHLGEGRLSAAAELADGDVLRFGGQLFTYRLVPPGAELGEAMPSDAMATVAVAFSADDSVRAEGDGSFEGNFEQFGFRDVVRFLALAKRTGTLFFDQSPMRRIGFRDGVPRQARCGSSSGRKALQDFAQRPGREFRFEPGQVMAGDDDIAGDAEAIVFELVDGGDEDLDADLERAKDLQEHLLARIPDLPGYALGLHYQGLNRVSGDFYDIGPLADGRFLVVVGDVTGHGVQAALVVAGIVKGLRRLRSEERDVCSLLARLNEEVRPDLLSGQFATLAACAFAPDGASAELVLCGHHGFQVLDGAGGIREEGRLGMALGMMPGTLFEPSLDPISIDIPVGTTLVQCTDGILEAAGAGEELYGEERFRDSLVEAQHEGDAQDLVNWAAASAQGWARRIDDDCTIIALQRREALPMVAELDVLDLADGAGRSDRSAQRSLAAIPAPAPGPGGQAPTVFDHGWPKRVLVADEGGAAGDYLLRGLVRSEVTGNVYAASQSGTEREVEIKVRREGIDGAAFRNEARVAAALEHPGVLPVYDCFVDDDGTPAYASQRLRGRDWRALMPRLGRRGNLVVLSRCCEALAYAHDRGIIHRDLKPGNVMVGQHGEAVLIAWGAAAGLADERPLSALIPKPQAGQVVGTPAYMPPEVAQSEAHRQDERTDVYGLGAILFELLVGEPPHPGDSVDEVQAGAAENRIAERRLGHPLFELALLAIATDPEQRPVSVLAFRHELDRRR